MTSPNHGPSAGPHANHDRLLISAHAAGDLAGRELEAATTLLASCAECRILHADLRSIAAATHDLPAPARAAVRDFRIAPDQAAALARGGLWRRLLRPFARTTGAARPLAAAFTTLGVAGLLLAALPTLQLAGGDALMATAPEATDSRNAVGATAVPEFIASPGTDTMGGSPMPDDIDTGYGAGSGKGSHQVSGSDSGSGAGPTAQPTADEAAAPDVVAVDAGGSSGPSPLIFLSVAFLVAGLGLVLLRLTALRLR